MSKLITTSKLSRFWTNAKSYIDTALSGKANTTHTHDYAPTTHSHTQNNITGLTDALADKAASNHTHTEYAETAHTHSNYATTSHTHTEYALKTEIPESMDIATDAEIDALFA